MKILLVATTTALCMTAGIASADSGFTVGASAGYSKIKDSEGGLSFDANDIGWKAFGTYMFTNGIGIEGGYVDFGKPDASIFGSNLAIDAGGWNLYAVGSLPLSERFDLFAKAGAIRWDADSIVDGVNVGSDSGTVLALGLGGRWNISDSLGFRSEFDWYDVSEADSVWMVSVGLEFRFR